MKEYHYMKLNQKEQTYYRKILAAVSKGESCIPLSFFMDRDTVKKIATSVNYDHPELFYVDFRHFSFHGSHMGMIYKVNYLETTYMRSLVASKLEKKISNILDMASRSNLQGAFDKCRWVHNYLVKNTHYNYEALKKPDMYLDAFNIKGVLIDENGVCEGISKAFNLLCDRLGVDSLMALGISSQVNFGANIRHSWNIVNLNGSYVHVDVTWDMGFSESSKYTRYDYFCISDRWMRKDHVYDSYPTCSTDLYSYFDKRGRVFSRSSDLQKYLEQEIKRRATVLYFKIDVSQGDLKSIQMKVQNQVEKHISANARSSYRLAMIPNNKQMCFFFRIQYSTG